MKEMGIKLADKSNEEKVLSIMNELHYNTGFIGDESKMKLTVDRFVNQEIIADPYKDRDSIHLIWLHSMYRNMFKVKSRRVYFSDVVRTMFENQTLSLQELLMKLVEEEEPKHRSSLYMARLFNNGKFTQSKYLSLFKSKEIDLILGDL